MTTIVIPQKAARGGELIAIPRKEYEEFSRWRGTIKQLKEFTPTPAQRRDLKRAREDYRAGKYLTLHELKRKLTAQSKRKGA